MTLETEKYDPIETHWVRVQEVSLDMPDPEKVIEGVYKSINRQALKEDKVVLNSSYTVVLRPGTTQFTIAYIVTVQVVSRAVLEQQRFKQQITRN